MIYTSRFVKYVYHISPEGERVVEDVLTLCRALLHRFLLVVEALLPVVQSGRAEAFPNMLALGNKVTE